jgi:hypothetical protein
MGFSHSFIRSLTYMASNTSSHASTEEPTFPRKGVCEPTKKVERFFAEYFRKHPLSREELLEVQRQKKLEHARRRTRSVGGVPVRKAIHPVLVRTHSEDA